MPNKNNKIVVKRQDIAEAPIRAEQKKYVDSKYNVISEQTVRLYSPSSVVIKKRIISV